MAPENLSKPTSVTSIDAVDGEFDLEAVIAWFAGDDSCVSHALPASLSPEQRQLAKKLVACHPHLECESYGFGPERQLHLFRKRCKGVRMRVKNTFIDAWLDGGDGKPGFTPVFRSLPSDWRSRVVAALVAPVFDESTGKEDMAQLCSTPSPCTSPKFQHFPSTPSPVEIQCDVGDDVEQLCSTPSPCTSPKLQHFPNAALCAKAHDPLGTVFVTSPRCAPSTEQNVAPAITSRPIMSVLPPPPASPTNVAMLARGTEVEIDGLLQRPDFNGLAGIVQMWDPVLRRYDVLLDPVGGGGPRRVKTKRENLRLRTSPPPPSLAALSTTIDLNSCIPMGAEEGFQHAGGSDMGAIEAISPSASVPPDSEGWYSWQFCEAGMSPHSDPSMSPHWHDTAKADNEVNMLANAEQFGGAGVGWDYNNNMLGFNEGADSAAWMQQPVCEAGFCNEWAVADGPTTL